MNTLSSLYLPNSEKVVQSLDIAYDKADSIIKQRIIGSIFPEKFQFVNNQVRTTKVNELIDRICSKINGFRANKKGQQSFYELLPFRVGATRASSNKLLSEIVKIKKFIAENSI